MGLPKVLIHCQYVYGLGHLIRALQLAKGLVSDFEVYLLSGGEAVEGIFIENEINFIQLDALYKEENSNKLSSVDDSLTTEECLVNREKVINSLIKDIRPDVVLTEHFPFGFLFEKEVLNLISKAKSANNQVKIISSVRDIIESKRGSESDQKTVTFLNEYYDLLLVHGDENIIPLETSFSLSNEVNIPQISTGYVVDNSLKKDLNRKKTIVVSVAGGRVGRELKGAVIDAFKSIQNEVNHKLLVFYGAFSNDAEQSNVEDKIQYFKFDRSVFLKELSQSDVSISLGGYNTMVESLYVGNKVLIYNREFLGHNFEQEIRISSLDELGFIKSLEAKHLELNKLADILLEAINSQSKPYIDDVNFEGVKRSVQEIKQLING
jgi:predicted glycosyltransferase